MVVEVLLSVVVVVVVVVSQDCGSEGRGSSFRGCSSGGRRLSGWL